MTPLDSGWIGSFQGVDVSPDGRRVGVGVFTVTGEEVHIRNLATGSMVRVSLPGHQLRGPFFSVDGSWLYFTAVGPGSAGIHRVAASPSAAPEAVLTSPDAILTQPSWTPDGETMFYTRLSPEGASFELRVRGTSEPVNDRMVSPANSASPQVSPDGRWLAYYTATSGIDEIVVRSVDPSRPEVWSVSGGEPIVSGTSRWSPDGSEIIYLGPDSVYATPVTGTETLTVGTRYGLAAFASFGQSFAVFPNGDPLMIRLHARPARPTRLIMIEDWSSTLGR